jgi:hypothetical protein
MLEHEEVLRKSAKNNMIQKPLVIKISSLGVTDIVIIGSGRLLSFGQSKPGARRDEQ